MLLNYIINYYLTINFNTQILWIKKIKTCSTHNYCALPLDGHSYDDWFDNPNDKKSNDSTLKDDEPEKLDDLLPPEGDEENLKEGKGILIQIQTNKKSGKYYIFFVSA